MIPHATTHGEARVLVFRSRSYPRCADRAFVLHALGLPCDFGFAPGGALGLFVPGSVAARALREIVAYEAEQGIPRPRTEAPDPASAEALRLAGRLGAVAYVLVLLLFAFLQTRYGGGQDWLDAGRLQAGRVKDGEWWRCMTALTLHLDLPHLLGNLIFGAVFGYFASLMLGSAALAWLTILLAGTAGNGVNALLQPFHHSAIGASTAVFAALGLIAAYQWRLQLHEGERWLRRLGPIIAGTALLALLGTGGERTDVSAHLTGFACGIVAGVLWSAQRRATRPPARWRIAGALASPLLLALAWTLAFAFG